MMDVEQSATEWFGSGPSIMRDWFVQAVGDEKQHRDIGKLLAPGAETYVSQWLSRMTGRQIRNIIGESYDGITTDDEPLVRHQVKFRSKDWHLEVTRRNSKKNEDSNETGHVKYSREEFDILVIFVPGPFFSLSQSHIRCIPIDALVDPKKQTHLYARVPQKIRKIYDTDEKTLEVIRSMYQKPPLLEDEYQIARMIDQVICKLVREFQSQQTDPDTCPPPECTE
jgi:hypothetical protein